LALARINNLSSYDAAYLHLSIKKGMSIATSDNRREDPEPVEGPSVALIPLVSNPYVPLRRGCRGRIFVF
jgi:hypothetical protein